MQWELREVQDTECTMDDSGVYVVVHRVVTTETHKEYSGERVSVRADLMGQRYVDSSGSTDGPTEDYAIMSWVGTANAVRKALIRFMADPMVRTGYLSPEHASYIGYELLRAETDSNYVQD